MNGKNPVDGTRTASFVFLETRGCICTIEIPKINRTILKKYKKKTNYPLHMKKEYARIETTKEGTATAVYPRIVYGSIKSRSLVRIVGGSFFWSKDDIAQHNNVCDSLDCFH